MHNGFNAAHAFIQDTIDYPMVRFDRHLRGMAVHFLWLAEEKVFIRHFGGVGFFEFDDLA